MNITLRKGQKEDIVFLCELEEQAFPAFQRSTKQALLLSLESPFQEVWIALYKIKGKPICCGAMILYLYRRSLRIYSIAVLPLFQNMGIGLRLLTHARNKGLARGSERISLEAHQTNTPLIAWYESQGFRTSEVVENYYTYGENAVKMVYSIPGVKGNTTVSNIIVVDSVKKWNFDIENVCVVSSRSYINDETFRLLKNARVFNLCQSYKYQSMGYYVSLLASAREHRSIPNITTIRDFRYLKVMRSIAGDIDDDIQEALKNINENHFVLNIYFGQSVTPLYRTLAGKIYQLFEAPLLRVWFNKTDKWLISKATPITLNDISEGEIERVKLMASKYFSKKRFVRSRLKNYKYDLAILIDPNEKTPPSSKLALQHFKRAAEKYGFFTEFISKDDQDRIGEFDALFIRETTSVSNHTYRFSRIAYAEGLVVIDDPWSILRCSNKIFLYERLKQNRVRMPKSWVLSKSTMNTFSKSDVEFPLILKQPDSSFSIGVVKVNNKEELQLALMHLFKKSDLIIAQEFLPSDFDWRIGVLDQTALFACKYFMAKGHWQIYNWNGEP